MNKHIPRTAFTLVELLVVIGIIALLISILLPALSAARASAYESQCASNIRQLVIALNMYATENKFKYPPGGEFPEPSGGTPQQNWWYDVDRIGRYLPKTYTLGNAGVQPNTGLHRALNPVMVCPSQPTEVKRSYAINHFSASSVGTLAAAYGVNVTAMENANGKFFSANVKNGAEIILITECIPRFLANATEQYAGPAANNILRGPGENFGATNNIWAPSIAGGPNDSKTWLAYYVHRKSKDAAPRREPRGRINIGYVDGHVSMKQHSDLADFVNNRTRLDSLWSNKDPILTN